MAWQRNPRFVISEVTANEFNVVRDENPRLSPQL
jgi:hypothetical protein